MQLKVQPLSDVPPSTAFSCNHFFNVFAFIPCFVLYHMAFVCLFVLKPPCGKNTRSIVYPLVKGILGCLFTKRKIERFYKKKPFNTVVYKID